MNLLIIYGGDSIESDYSVEAFHHLIKYLKPKFQSVEGLNLNNFLNNSQQFTKIKQYDVVLSLVYGTPGQEGIVQGICELLKVPYIGSDLYTCSLIKDKYMTNNILKTLDIKTAFSISLDKSFLSDPQSLTDLVLKNFELPVVIKPRKKGGLSLGTYYCSDSDSIYDLCTKAFNYDDEIIVEQYINGKEVICCALEYSNDIRILPLIYVDKHTNILDYNAKTKGLKKAIINPLEINKDYSNKIKNITRSIFRELNFKDWGYFEFILDNNGYVYFIESGAIPGMTEKSNIPILMNYIEEDLALFIYQTAKRRTTNG